MKSSCCLISLLFVLTCFSVMIPPGKGSSVYNLQVGAFGDGGSIGNIGVQVEIRTHIYTITAPVLSDAFWVGDNLANGAFIQFGYELQVRGSYCTYSVVVVGHISCQGPTTSVGDGDPRWFWEFWPNIQDPSTYSFGMDQFGGFVGSEGSWHNYRIIADPAGWNLELDGLSVAVVNSPSIESSQPAYVVAEEVTSKPQASGNLGPVEFRNLGYYKNSAWHGVETLNAISNCGALNPYCGVSIPYGVSVEGPNDILTGAGMKLRQDGEYLWGSLTLTITFPISGVVMVDGKDYDSGSIKLAVPPGLHSLSIEPIVQFDNGSRLRFDHWSDDSLAINRTLRVNSDISLEGIYVSQYELIIESQYPTAGGGWYDVGSIANFSTSHYPIYANNSLWSFSGWYNQNGILITNLGSGSILMDSSHVLEARWHADYTLVYVAVITVGLVVVLFVVYSRKRRVRQYLVS